MAYKGPYKYVNHSPPRYDKFGLIEDSDEPAGRLKDHRTTWSGWIFGRVKMLFGWIYRHPFMSVFIGGVISVLFIPILIFLGFCATIFWLALFPVFGVVMTGVGIAFCVVLCVCGGLYCLFCTSFTCMAFQWCTSTDIYKWCRRMLGHLRILNAAEVEMTYYMPPQLPDYEEYRRGQQ